MAQTYEFPPSLTHYRPIRFYQGDNHLNSLTLRHHFFITRAKIVLKEIFGGGNPLNPPKADYFVQNEIVRHPNFHIAFPWVISGQENVLISQGWCAALGVAVPTPFFVQQYLLASFEKPAFAFRDSVSFVKIICATEVSELDRRFHDDVIGGEGNWWADDTKTPLSFRTMWRMLEQRTDAVGLTNCNGILD
jgi:hypothetical protein